MMVEIDNIELYYILSQKGFQKNVSHEAFEVLETVEESLVSGIKNIDEDCDLNAFINSLEPISTDTSHYGTLEFHEDLALNDSDDAVEAKSSISIRSAIDSGLEKLSGTAFTLFTKSTDVIEDTANNAKDILGESIETVSDIAALRVKQIEDTRSKAKETLSMKFSVSKIFGM